MILWMRSKFSGSKFFIHLSFEAVKFPGEFSKWLRQKSSPNSLDACPPMATALLSH